jgi:phage terminase large subunit-like protein
MNAAALATLRTAARAANIAANKADRDPILRMDWLPPQRAFLDERARVKLLRTGNQIGKTTVGLAECVMIAEGRHPFQRIPPPVEIWVITQSRSQGLAVQGKLAALLSPDSLSVDQKPYNPVTGYGHHEAVVRFRNGSLIRFRTVMMGGNRLNAGTVHHILMDEPPPERIYAECLSRLRATNGTLSITMTPINVDCAWMEEACDSGRIADLHFRLTAEHMTHTRSGRPRTLPDGTVCDAGWIETVRASCLPHEVGVVCDGEWRVFATDKYFATFKSTGETCHVSARIPEGEVKVCIGIDHGIRAGRQGAVLALVDEKTGSDHPPVFILDEFRPNDQTTPEQDADALLAMLERHGLKWADVDYVWGDRDAESSSSRGTITKGNLDLEIALSRRLETGSYKALRPRIMSAKRGSGTGVGRGAVDVGCRWLLYSMIRNEFKVHPRCQELIKSIDNWNGDPKSEHKDLIDSLRYSLLHYIRGKHRRGPVVGVRLFGGG